MARALSYDLSDLPRHDINMLNAYGKNTMIVDVYEPGSTFKIFTTASAIEENKVNGNDRFYCAGYRMVDGQRIKCWRAKGHGSQDLSQGVCNSCNCVFMDLAGRLGTNKFYEYLRKFGFGLKTGVDFFAESSGLLMKESTVKNVDLARIGFGQAIAVTPLQLISGVCAVVNGGIYHTPRFVNSVIDNAGNVVYQHDTQSRRVLSESTSRTMVEMLEKVVSEGSGKKAGVLGYLIGGKTGTAQKYENGVIAQGKYVSSFIGFAPADNPKYAILLTVDEPSGYAYYGSIVSAPYVGQIFAKIFDYLQIQPTVTEEIEYALMPNLVGKTLTDAIKILDENDITYEIDGDGEVVSATYPSFNEKISNKDVILVKA
ncbi:MAG: PASTA domain-containing protein, partial [Clostridia bacterium]|nr:PASTA domain-containing protein [Clostridia bacterium]